MIELTRKEWSAVTGIDLFLIVLVLFATQPESPALIAGYSLFVLTTVTIILLHGIPKLREKVSYPKNITVMFSLFVPYLIAIVTGASGINEVPLFLIWYLVPAFLFVLSKYFSDKWRLLFVIVATGLLWIGFDHRYTKYLFNGYSDSYLFNSLWMAAVGLSSYDDLFSGKEYDRGIYPTKQGFKIANIVTPLASLVVIPFGILTGFLEWNPKISFEVIFIGFIGIFFTISLQEELIFRGILLREFDKFKTPVVSLIVVSALFAFTHWNNEVPQFVWHYFFAAFVAGVAYGIAYRRGGLFGAMLSHTLVDWIWAIFLKRGA